MKIQQIPRFDIMLHIQVEADSLVNMAAARSILPDAPHLAQLMPALLVVFIGSVIDIRSCDLEFEVLLLLCVFDRIDWVNSIR